MKKQPKIVGKQYPWVHEELDIKCPECGRELANGHKMDCSHAVRITVTSTHKDLP